MKRSAQLLTRFRRLTINVPATEAHGRCMETIIIQAFGNIHLLMPELLLTGADQ